MKKNFDIILMVVGGILVVGNLAYLIKVTGAENIRSITQLAPGILGLFFALVSMALNEMNSGEKTAKEAVITVAVEMLMLGLFILIATFLRK
ncbi:MAG: hypothetical protein GXO35_00985 [Gammaproteobacteria bacterium]|nr:hypothetical protein [Gammaproteobacteria bacterium]